MTGHLSLYMLSLLSDKAPWSVHAVPSLLTLNIRSQRFSLITSRLDFTDLRDYPQTLSDDDPPINKMIVKGNFLVKGLPHLLPCNHHMVKVTHSQSTSAKQVLYLFYFRRKSKQEILLKLFIPCIQIIQFDDSK